MRRRGRASIGAVALSCALLACGGPAPTRDGGSGFPDAGPTPELPLALYRIEPARGPFIGGNVVRLRGSGFSEAAFGEGCAPCGVVTFDGAEAALARLVDEHRLELVVPAGEPGPADVVIRASEREAILREAYLYEALAITPGAGSVTGGTLVSIRAAGGSFGVGTRVLFAGAECTDLVVDAPGSATCFTPPGELGLVDVEAITPGAPSLGLPDAFRYEDPIIREGGLGGGRFTGTIEVVVLGRDGPLEGAIVLAGNDPDSLLRQSTDRDGRATLAARDLRAPLDLHIAGLCHHTVSFIGFDAARATVYLFPSNEEACVEPPPPPDDPDPVVPPVRTWVEGELLFGDGDSPGGWVGVPAPGLGESRIAYVFTTSLTIRSSNPDPDPDGTGVPVVYELPTGDRGYPYRINSRASLVAIVALAGIRTPGGVFTASMMGIARGQLLAPNEERRGVDIRMNVPLDREVTVRATGLPSVDVPPVLFRASAHLVIEEGFIVRTVGGSRMPWVAGTNLDEITSPTPSMTFAMQPSLEGDLADARYDLVVEWAMNEWGGAPMTRRVRRGVTDVREVVVFDGFLDVPEAITPLEGATFDGRTIRWADGGPDPDGALLGLSSYPFQWTMFVRGDLREVRLPELADLGLERDPGDMNLSLRTWIIPGFDFHALRFAQLALERTATHDTYSTYSAIW